MALTKITKSGLTGDVVDETKIADNAISEEHLDTTVVTGLTELSEEANNNDTLIVYDTSAGALKKILRSNLILQGPTVSSVSPTSVTSGDGTGNYTFTITGTGFTSASASLVNNSGTTVAFDTVTVDSATQITGVIAKSSLPGSGEPYDVKVTGSNGLATTLENQINIDQSPTYNTASGSIGSVSDGARGSVTFEVEAFDPESAGNVTFEIQSGSLPAGATATTVHENGVSKYQISGFSAVVGSTTSTFVLRAVDAASNTSSRSFSITVLAPTSESFTSSGTFSVPVGLTSVDVLVVAGGGGAGSDNAGGGGAGGLIFMPAYPVTPGGTVSVTVGCGSLGTGAIPGSEDPLSNGQDSVFGTLTAKGGGAGGGVGVSPTNPQGRIGLPGGSGGGGARFGPGHPCSGSGNNVGLPGSATQPTQPGNSGAYGFGNPGGTGSQSGNGSGGGGGGAGGAGTNGTSPAGGPGGVGKAYTIADGTTPVYYAGGGGGGIENAGSSGGSGGQGGGGAGGNSVPVGPAQGGNAQANKGGGGGGGGMGGQGNPGGNGGKGIVIVRY